MGRRAHIIGREIDVWGDPWVIREYRPTEHGFDLALGWPEDQDRGRGGAGGPRVILTPPLAEYLERHRRETNLISLPVGRGVVKRLRSILGHHRYLDAAEWWEERIEDLATLTLQEFADRHGRTVSAVERARLALLGPQQRPAEWWRRAAVRRIVLTLPAALAADRLGISAVSVYRLRVAFQRRETDIWGVIWVVNRSIPTGFGWEIKMGRPARGSSHLGGPKVIITKELYTHLTTSTLPRAGLPLSHLTLTRLRAACRTKKPGGPLRRDSLPAPCLEGLSPRDREIVETYLSGGKAADLAAGHRLSRETIYNIVRRACGLVVFPRRRGRPRKRRPEDVEV